MSFRVICQVFLKDAQRLWWVILLTLLLLGRLTHFDSWRSTAMPGSDEGWLNILLPLAWSLLIALAVFEDSAAAESPFWMTLPCRWRPVLAAKALFTLAFVHVPYLVACAVIMQSRGLGVLENIPALLLRQLILLAFTIPAIAAATVVRNVTQYMSVAIVLATLVGTIPIGGEPLANQGFIKEMRETILFSITALTGVWIALEQYRHRRTTMSGTAGIVAVAIASIVWLLPSERFDGIQAALFPLSTSLPRPGIQLAEGPVQRGFADEGRMGLMIPISTSAPPSGYVAQFRQSSLEIREPDGRTESAKPQMYRVHLFGNADGPEAGLGGGTTPNRQIVEIDRPTLARISASPVTIQGTALAMYYRDGEPNWLSVNQTISIRGAGICTSQTMGDFPQNESLRVSCESARTLSPVHITLLDPADDRHWKRDLNSSRNLTEYPTGTWLSPVERADVYFPLTDEEHYAMPNQQWQMPREALPRAKIGITPSFPQGSTLIHYELPNVRLDQYRGH